MNNRIFKEHEDRFGLSMENKKICFFAPAILLDNIENLTKFEEISMLKDYMKILKNYAKYKEDSVIHSYEARKTTRLDVIEAYINIVNDYIQNGDFRIFIKLNNKSSNRINWSKTLKNNDVIIQKKKFIYRNFQSSNKQVNHDDVFFKIYSNILNDATTMFLYGPIYETTSKINENESLYYINKYIDTHFRDRELFIAEQLKIIHSSKLNSNIDENLFPVKYHDHFEHIFQFLVEENIKEFSQIKEKRNGKYKNLQTNEITSGMSLRLDHFIKINNRHFIIDSKYYRNIDFIGQPNGLPKTADIIKQVGYKVYIAHVKKIHHATIDNIFLFPKLDNDVDLEHFAIHTVIDDPNNYFTVKCIKIDVKILIKNYLSRKTHIDFINLLKTI